MTRKGVAAVLSVILALAVTADTKQNCEEEFTKQATKAGSPPAAGVLPIRCGGGMPFPDHQGLWAGPPGPLRQLWHGSHRALGRGPRGPGEPDPSRSRRYYSPVPTRPSCATAGPPPCGGRRRLDRCRLAGRDAGNGLAMDLDDGASGERDDQPGDDHPPQTHAPRSLRTAAFGDRVSSASGASGAKVHAISAPARRCQGLRRPASARRGAARSMGLLIPCDCRRRAVPPSRPDGARNDPRSGPRRRAAPGAGAPASHPGPAILRG